MIRKVLYIFLCCGFAVSLSSQVVDYPVDLELLKGADVTNYSPINTEGLEFSPTFYNDGIIYVASRPRTKKKKNKEQQFTFDLKYYDLKNGSKVKDFYEKDINDLHHFGPCAFNPIGKEIFYSENYTDKKGADGRYHMKLIRAVYQNDDWEVIDDFPFNSHEYSIFHPAISKDGMTMIFASNMPGGYGKMDLYSISKTGNSWGLPVNLGPEVNSVSNDWFPTFHENDYIFYSSDSQGGLGGLDIFVCKYIEGEWRFPQNLDSPVNSKKDDIGFALSADASYGFFSSNRAGGVGEDDIYKFELTQPLVFDDLQNFTLAQEEKEVVEVITEEVKPAAIVKSNFQYLVLDNNSKSAIRDAEINFTPMLSQEQMSDKDFKEKNLVKDRKTGKLKWLSSPNPTLLASKESTRSDVSGKANINLQQGQLYLVEVIKDGYNSDRSIIDVDELMNQAAIFINLNKREIIAPSNAKPVAVVNTADNTGTNSSTAKNSDESNPTLKIPDSIGDLLVFENVLYDYNEATIRKGGTKELQELADYMKKYPQLEVELSSHTDAIGSALYNLNLSQKRAEVAKQFLVDQGIAPYRIVAKGYGELVIRNHCVEGVICTDDEHAYNRRTELKITKK